MNGNQRTTLEPVISVECKEKKIKIKEIIVLVTDHDGFKWLW